MLWRQFFYFYQAITIMEIHITIDCPHCGETIDEDIDIEVDDIRQDLD